MLYIWPSVAYTAGLLHDIGKLVIDRVITPENRQAMERLTEKEKIAGAEAERRVLGTTHAEAGGCLLRKWGLPAVLVEAVEHHHAPTYQPPPELSCVVHLANTLAHQVGKEAKEELELSATAKQAGAVLGLTATDLESEWRALQQRMEKLEQFSAA